MNSSVKKPRLIITKSGLLPGWQPSTSILGGYSVAMEITIESVEWEHAKAKAAAAELKTIK